MGQWTEMGRNFDDSGVPRVNGPSWVENLLTRCTLVLVYLMTQVYLDPGEYLGGQGQGQGHAFKDPICIYCLSVTLLNVRGCGPDFAMKALEHRNDSHAVG